MAGEEGGSTQIPLAGGLEVHCAISELDGAVEVGLVREGEVVDTETLPPGAGPKTIDVDLGPLEVSLALNVNHEIGEVHGKGKVVLHEPILDTRHTLLDIDEVLLRYAPTHGSVGGSRDPDPMVVEDSRFGTSRSSSKNVTRFIVDEHERQLSNVGRLVKETLWKDYPPWVFNTVACVGPFDEAGRGSYSDPDSVWFNVFLGYYQIDAPKPEWTRPFAYRSADGADSEIVFEEVVRLGKSDWNYFSNWMYGVPPVAVRRHDEIDMSALTTTQTDAGVIGARSWHRARIDGVEFVTSYESDTDGADRLVDNSVLSGVWRKAFGLPNPRPEWTESFVRSTLDADAYMSWWEDDDAFHTVIFGGTASSSADPAFLEAQLAAARTVIERTYPELGFDTA